jgi:hypothetical protein
MRVALSLALATLFAAFTSSIATAQPSGIMAPGDAAVTGFSGVPAGQASERIDRDGPSLRVIGLPGSGAYGLVNAPKRFTAKARDIGQVFGVALDNQAAPDIFVSATSAYGLGLYRPGHGRLRNGAPGAQFTPGQFGPADQGGGTGSIWKIDGRTGQISLFANVSFNGIQNTPASLGALAFDANTQQLFVSDRGTGLIHRFSMDGTDRGTFDHGTQGRGAAHIQTVPFDPATLANIESARFDAQDPRSWGFAPPMRRVFALAMHEGRLFYSVASGAQIWSVGIAGNGAFMDDARFETAISVLRPGVEVSQIAFNGRGEMFVAERGAPTGSPDFIAVADGGQNRVLRFQPKQNGDPSPGYWHAPSDEYAIGMFPNFQNADGGVNLTCGRTVWSTGERLLDPGSPGSFPLIDGLQGNDSNLVKPANMPPSQAWYVNYYDNQTDPASRGHMGAVAIWNVCGGAPPPPPPPPSGGGTIGFNCPPGTFAIGGACLVPPVCPEETIWRNGYCVFPRCPDGFVSIRGECRRPPVVCREGEIYLRDRCIPIGCPPRLERDRSGYCRCPQDLAYRDGQCTPPCPNTTLHQIGQPINEQCPCPRDTVRDRDGQCGCPPEAIRTGQCCPPEQRRDDNGRCVPNCQQGAVTLAPANCPCPPGDVRNSDGRCVPNCQQGASILAPSNCPCPPGDTRNSDGRCVPNCPPSATGLPNCPCPQGDTRNSDGRCVPSSNCPPGTVALTNCPCPPGEQKNSDGRCVKTNPCPPGITATANCPTPCPPGQQRNADGRCYTPLTLAPSAPGRAPLRCPRGEYRGASGRCHWPTRTTVTHTTTTVTHTTTTCGRGERLEGGSCVPVNNTSTTTNTVPTRGCADGEVYRRGHCVSSDNAAPSGGLGCSRAVYDRLGHCPTPDDNNGTSHHRPRFSGGNDSGYPGGNTGGNGDRGGYPSRGAYGSGNPGTVAPINPGGNRYRGRYPNGTPGNGKYNTRDRRNYNEGGNYPR